MNISKLVIFFVVLTMAFTAIQCKKSSPTEGDISDFVGAWKAGATQVGTQMNYTSKEEPSTEFKLVQLGATIDVVVKSDNTYTLTLLIPLLEINEVEKGKMTIDGNKVTMTADDYPDEAITFDYNINGDMLSLISDDTEFDFNFDDVDEPAILSIILKKQ